MRTHKRLGEILIEEGIINEKQLEDALNHQRGKGGRTQLGQILMDAKLVTREQLVMAVEKQLGVPHVWLRRGMVDPKIVTIVPKEKAHRYKVIPMFVVGKSLIIGMSDTRAVYVLDDLARTTGLKIQPVACRADDITALIPEYYDGGATELAEMPDILPEMEQAEVEVVNNTYYQTLEMVQEKAEGAYVINLVNLIILNGIKAGASDVHLEPDKRLVRIRYRIDGVLREILTIRTDYQAALVSRIKIMANLDIAEHRAPQDGRIHVLADNREVDIRVSMMPTVFGEKVVLRLLDRSKLVLDLNHLGFSEATLNSLKRMLFQPHGMILVTGPTGSGKTTTLYAALELISTIEKNIVTIEDPVEYQFELINQVQVREAWDLTFARALRTILRQDPDIIMVGEIRDRETAVVAVQAAMTGHLVLSTLHTNDSAGAVSRMLDMGIEPYLLNSTLLGVIAQRLIRTICPNCKSTHFPPRQLLERIGWQGNPDVPLAHGAGCEKCFDTGFKGRQGIYELFEITDEAREAIVQKQPVGILREIRARSGYPSLKEEAFSLVERHVASVDEAIRTVMVNEARGEEKEITELLLRAG